MDGSRGVPVPGRLVQFIVQDLKTLSRTVYIYSNLQRYSQVIYNLLTHLPTLTPIQLLTICLSLSSVGPRRRIPR